MEQFIYGLVIGYFLYPLFRAAIKIAYNAKGCNGECNQGRKQCTCRGQLQ